MTIKATKASTAKQVAFSPRLRLTHFNWLQFNLNYKQIVVSTKKYLPVYVFVCHTSTCVKQPLACQCVHVCTFDCVYCHSIGCTPGIKLDPQTPPGHSLPVAVRLIDWSQSREKLNNNSNNCIQLKSGALLRINSRKGVVLCAFSLNLKRKRKSSENVQVFVFIRPDGHQFRHQRQSNLRDRQPPNQCP